MTDEEREILYKKFDKDMEKRSWFMRSLLVLDQTFNVLLWNGSQDETISSHIHRRQEAGISNWFDDLICNILKIIESKHCLKSKGE